MSIRHAILGFLSWKPASGYEIKKFLADSTWSHWSGNNNQVYTTLVQLHREGLVTVETVQQEKYPARKMYAIEPSGFDELRRWLVSMPELPELRSAFHVQLAWGELLGDDDIVDLLGRYERELEGQLLLRRELARRGREGPSRSPREAFLWKRIDESGMAALETELEWTRATRAGLFDLRRRTVSGGGK